MERRRKCRVSNTSYSTNIIQLTASYSRMTPAILCEPSSADSLPSTGITAGDFHCTAGGYNPGKPAIGPQDEDSELSSGLKKILTNPSISAKSYDVVEMYYVEGPKTIIVRANRKTIIMRIEKPDTTAGAGEVDDGTPLAFRPAKRAPPASTSTGVAAASNEPHGQQLLSAATVQKLSDISYASGT